MVLPLHLEVENHREKLFPENFELLLSVEHPRLSPSLQILLQRGQKGLEKEFDVGQNPAAELVLLIVEVVERE